MSNAPVASKYPNPDLALNVVTVSLTSALGRHPTEKEVMDFISGDEETRTRIWNSRSNG